MGRAQREKGKRGELEVVKILNRVLREEMGLDDLRAQRVLTETREGSYDVEVVDVGDGRVFDVGFQVKNVKAQHGGYLVKAYRQVVEEAEVPVGVTKLPLGGRSEWVAIVPLWLVARYIGMSHFLEMKGESFEA